MLTRLKWNDFRRTSHLYTLALPECDLGLTEFEPGHSVRCHFPLG